MNKITISAAEAKRDFAELLARVAYGKETITITRHGKPMAVLTPPSTPEGLAAVKGWLDDDDPFFTETQGIVKDRKKHRMRRVRLSKA